MFNLLKSSPDLMSIKLYPEDSRLTTYPIFRKNIWEIYKRAEASFWSTGEVDLSTDFIDFNTKINDKERFFIEHVLAFFAASDGIVNENLCHKFRKEFEVLEIKYFYDYQIMMENIHAEMYSLLIDTYIRDLDKRKHLFNAVQNIPAVERKAQWCFKWMNSDRPLAERLIAFACVEGIFFSGSFCAIDWLKTRGLFKGLTQANELISRDENMHCEFACMLHSLMIEPVSDEIIKDIVLDAVSIESQFIESALPWDLKEMNSRMMILHIKHVADNLLQLLNVSAIWNVKSPFSFANFRSMEVKNNMHETKGTSYRKSNGVSEKKILEDF